MLPQFLISAAHKSSGKTVVSVGLAGCFSAQGRVVQSFKKGPDYIDPMWLSSATGRPCINLDFNTQSHAEINACYARYSQDADLVLVEGNKGLYDGMDVHGSDCNAALAAQLDLPVILVVNCQGITRGVAPLLIGYQQFAEDIHLAGVILNKVAGPRHESKLVAAIETYTDLPVIGAVRRNPALEIEERHLGLIPSNEHDMAAEWINNVGQLVADGIDTERLLELSTRPAKQVSAVIDPVISGQGLRLGVARDAAFGFYYADDLEQFERRGVELVFIDTLADNALPEIDALFLGGGFPETHLPALQKNQSMRDTIKRFADHGGIIYAECGGLMYLCRHISWGNTDGKMCAVLDADIEMQTHPVGRGYMELDATVDHPWGVKPGNSVKAHEFHYSRLVNSDMAPEYAYQVKRGQGIDGEFDGLIHNNVLATYVHQRHTEANPWIDAFLRFIRENSGH